jgi:hypothetical protein
MKKADALFIYARLLDEDGEPVEVNKIPSVYLINNSIANTAVWSGLGSYARVVGHVPEFFSYWPGAEHYYKVELDPSDQRVRLFLEQSMGLPACSIDKIDIHLKNSIQYKDGTET